MSLFQNFYGNKAALSILTSILQSGRIGHAYIFEGAGGSGKRTLSRLFAKAAMCNSRSESEPCCVCSNCVKMDLKSHPDYIVIDEGGKSIGIDRIRDLKHDLYIIPNEADRKFYVIIDGQNMTMEAQNALLKAFEEPPEYATIIITVNSKAALLPVIQSRGTLISIKPVTLNEVEHYLIKNSIVKNETVAKNAAELSCGIIGRALETINSKELESLKKVPDIFFHTLIKTDRLEFVSLMNILTEYKENIELVFSLIIRQFRDILVYKATKDEKILISGLKSREIISYVSSFTSKQILEIIDLIEITRAQLSMNVNFNSAVFNMLCKSWEEIHD